MEPFAGDHQGSGPTDGSNCQIRRTGIVTRFEPDIVVLEFGDKEIRVPAAKVSPDVRAGDEVMWTGSRWCVTSLSG